MIWLEVVGSVLGALGLLALVVAAWPPQSVRNAEEMDRLWSEALRERERADAAAQSRAAADALPTERQDGERVT